MEVIKSIIVAVLLLVLCSLILYLIAGIICQATKGRVFGKLCHKISKRHWPDKNAKITLYRSGNEMSYCKYCGRRIMKLGKDWFTLLTGDED